MTLTAILTYLVANKEIIVGATVTVCEVVVTVYNYYRHNKAEKALASQVSESATKLPVYVPKTVAQKILWSMNPLNVFKNPIKVS